MEKTHDPHTGTTPAAPAPPINTILVPMGFDACSSRALTYALDLARRHGAAVQVLHVIDMVEGDAASPLRYSPEAAVLHETPQQMLYAHLEREIAGHDTEGLTVVPVTKRGMAVASTVVTYADREGADLIVLGTHSRRGMKRLLLGSIAEQIVRKAPCDVLIVAAKG